MPHAPATFQSALLDPFGPSNLRQNREREAQKAKVKRGWCGSYLAGGSNLLFSFLQALLILLTDLIWLLPSAVARKCPNGSAQTSAQQSSRRVK